MANLTTEEEWWKKKHKEDCGSLAEQLHRRTAEVKRLRDGLRVIADGSPMQYKVEDYAGMVLEGADRTSECRACNGDESKRPCSACGASRSVSEPRQIAEIQARLKSIRENYAVHIGCGGEAIPTTPVGTHYACQRCGRLLPCDAIAEECPHPDLSYVEDVEWLLQTVSELKEALRRTTCDECP